MTDPDSGHGSDSGIAPSDRLRFVRDHTVLGPVPMVPEIRIQLASALLPLWSATEEWLTERGVPIPFWSVPWAGGQALARWVLDHPECVRGRTVLDVGTGSGLVAIAAARAGAAHVRAVDIDPLACVAAEHNAEANDVRLTVACRDAVGLVRPADVVLAGDVWYEADASQRFEAWFHTLAREGVRVLSGDPGRMFVPQGPREVAAYDVPVSLDWESRASLRTRIISFEPG